MTNGTFERYSKSVLSCSMVFELVSYFTKILLLFGVFSFVLKLGRLLYWSGCIVFRSATLYPCSVCVCIQEHTPVLGTIKICYWRCHKQNVLLTSVTLKCTIGFSITIISWRHTFQLKNHQYGVFASFKLCFR